MFTKGKTEENPFRATMIKKDVNLNPLPVFVIAQEKREGKKVKSCTTKCDQSNSFECMCKFDNSRSKNQYFCKPIH